MMFVYTKEPFNAMLNRLNNYPHQGGGYDQIAVETVMVMMNYLAKHYQDVMETHPFDVYERLVNLIEDVECMTDYEDAR